MLRATANFIFGQLRVLERYTDAPADSHFSIQSSTVFMINRLDVWLSVRETLNIYRVEPCRFWNNGSERCDNCLVSQGW